MQFITIAGALALIKIFSGGILAMHFLAAIFGVWTTYPLSHELYLACYMSDRKKGRLQMSAQK